MCEYHVFMSSSIAVFIMTHCSDLCINRNERGSVVRFGTILDLVLAYLYKDLVHAYNKHKAVSQIFNYMFAGSISIVPLMRMMKISARLRMTLTRRRSTKL